jgi:hypothetical protein
MQATHTQQIPSLWKITRMSSVTFRRVVECIICWGYGITLGRYKWCSIPQEAAGSSRKTSRLQIVITWSWKVNRKKSLWSRCAMVNVGTGTELKRYAERNDMKSSPPSAMQCHCQDLANRKLVLPQHIPLRPCRRTDYLYSRWISAETTWRMFDDQILYREWFRGNEMKRECYKLNCSREDIAVLFIHLSVGTFAQPFRKLTSTSENLREGRRAVSSDIPPTRLGSGCNKEGSNSTEDFTLQWLQYFQGVSRPQ